MRPDRLPSLRVKCRPWYYPMRHKQPTRAAELTAALKREEVADACRED